MTASEWLVFESSKDGSCKCKSTTQKGERLIKMKKRTTDVRIKCALQNEGEEVKEEIE
jgi:hypothetical protein